jgi:hypothetical protein
MAIIYKYQDIKMPLKNDSFMGLRIIYKYQDIKMPLQKEIQLRINI